MQKFIVDNEADINGTSLLKAIKTTTGRLRKLFGCQPGMGDSVQKKYTDSFTVRDSDNGEIFTIYRCYGEWRIGGNRDACSSLGVLMEKIEPKLYAGQSRVPSQAILETRRLYWEDLPNPADYA